MVVLVYAVVGAVALVSALIAYLRQPHVDLVPAQMLVSGLGCAGAIAAYFADRPRLEMVMLGVAVVAAFAALRTMRRYQAGHRG